MGGLRLQQHKHSLAKRLPCLALQFIMLASLSLTSCAPATQDMHLEFFFSEQVWGGSPFNEVQKKQVFVTALKARDTERISEPVPFEISNTSIRVKRFAALYEVDANLGLPKVRSGYVLELSLGATPPERITLTNTFTGVSWSIKLTPSSNE
jgi:hypothetical protein